MSSLANKRILKEIKDLQKAASSDNTILLASNPDSLNNVLIDIYIPASIYNASTPFTISYIIGTNYPFSPPQIQFVGDNIPLHPHIYSNGHICLNILYDGWSPAQNILSVALSLQSMLCNNKTLEAPPDDENYCSHCPSNPLASKWDFHDDNV